METKRHHTSIISITIILIAILFIFNEGRAYDEFPIATTTGREMAISAAFDGTNYLVGIQTITNGLPSNIAAQMISSTGSTVGALIDTCRTGTGSSIAFDGTNYLMIWEDDIGGHWNEFAYFTIYGQFISKAGAKVGSPFAISSSGIEFDGINILSYGGGKYLATYTKLINPANGENSDNRYIAGRFIQPNGTLGSEFRISTGYGAKNTMTFDGTNFFVIWVEDSQDKEVRGRFVSPTGVLGTEISINASAAPSDNPLAVAFDGTNYLVAWNDEMSAGEWNIFGQLVKPNGTLTGGPITIENNTDQQMITSIAFDGTNYFVVWVDMINDANNDGICDAGEGTCWDVYGRYIGKDGTPAGNKFVINNDAENQIGFVTNYHNNKYLVVVNSGIVLGENGIQGGDVYGMFITPPASAGSIQLSSATYSVGEAGPTVTITATRTGGSSGAVGISYSTSNGTATAGSDYTLVSGTLSWANGDTANKTFTAPITNDALAETSETFTVTLSSPTGGATLGSPGSATVTIIDNDATLNQLTVIKSGTGSGDITPNIGTLTWSVNQGTGNYSSGDIVILTATPALHSSFKVWKGCTTISGNTCTVSMTAAKTVTATFTADPKYAVKAVKSGKGTGTITSDLAGISCPGDCTESYWKTEVVTLTATPSANSMFSGWSGSCTGTQSTCSLTMTASKSVTATFVPLNTLNVLAGASWSLDRPVTTATITWINKEGEAVKSEAISGEIQIIADPAKLTASDVQNIVFAHGGTIFARLPVVGLYWAKIPEGTEASFISSLQELVSDVFPNLVLESKYLTEGLTMPRDYTYSTTNPTPVKVSSANVIIDDFSYPMCLNCSPEEREEGQVPTFVIKDTVTNKVKVDANGHFITTTDYTKAATHGDIVNYYSTNKYTLNTSNASSNLCDTSECSKYNMVEPEEGGFVPYESMYLRIAAVLKGASDISKASTINFSQGPGEYIAGEVTGWETYNQTNNWSSLSSVLSVLDSRVKGTDEAMVVMAAGNGSTNITKMLITEQMINPKAFEKVIMVGALDAAGNIAGYSNYSTYSAGMIYVKVDGVTNTGVPINGTSFAAPQVQYLINRLREARPDLTPGQIRQIIFDPRLSPRQSVLIPNDPDSNTMEVPVITDPLSQPALDTAILVAGDLFPTGTPAAFTLSISKTGTGNGTVSANPSGPSYTAGTSVTLTASPDSNSTFTGWSGACAGTQSTCTLTMTASKSVTATFTASPSGLNVYYVFEGVYNARPNEPIPEGHPYVIASMTLPNGWVSQGSLLTPYTSSTGKYTSGATISVRAESVLSYTTITVKIYRDGVLWKSDTATATGYGNYAVATVSGTL